MSDDIVTRLRICRLEYGTGEVCVEAADEIERLRRLLRQASDDLNTQADEIGDEVGALALEAQQWWLLAAEYRNSGDHAARCLGNLRCRLCDLFHRMEKQYKKNHAAGSVLK